MGVYTVLLDELFGSDLLDGKKQPTMMDSAHTVNVGYSYKGFWRKAPLLGKEPDIASAITDIFGLADPDVRGGRSPHVSLSASTVFSAHKSGECLHSPMLKLDFQLTHMLNVAVFRFTELLPELDKQDAATEKIAMLNRTLAMDWDRTGRDHFAELKRVKQQN